MCKVYGYCRISTKQQSIDRQIRNIKDQFPDAIMVTESFTGTKLDRPQWNRLYKNVKSGDTIVFDSVSRMSRNAEEGFAVYSELFNRGVELIFLKEHYIDTSTYKNASEGQIRLNISTGDDDMDDLVSGMTAVLNKYLARLAQKQIVQAFQQAEKEVEDLHQRTKEGIETARLKGKQIGGVAGKKLITKKSIEAKKEIRKYSKEFEGTLGDPEVMKLTGLARNTYYKYKRELKAELASTISDTINYYKIKIRRDEAPSRCWLGTGHGILYFTTERLAMVLSEKAVKSKDILDFVAPYEYEIVPTDDIHRLTFRIFDDEFTVYKEDEEI